MGQPAACHWLRVSRHHRKELNCAIFGTHPGRHPTTPRGPTTGTMGQAGTGKGRLEEVVEEPETQGTAEPGAPWGPLKSAYTHVPSGGPAFRCLPR